MSLLAALAKGIGAGTVNNAQVGFAEQQRLREAAQRKEEMLAQSTQRKEEMTEEYNRRDAQLKTQIEANQADTKARLDAQKDENKNNRDHDWAMFERRLAIETQAAAANADARSRAGHAKNIMGTMDLLMKRKTEVLKDDKLSDQQRATAAREIDMLGYAIAADPGSQSLLNEFGGGGYVQYGLSLAPKKDPNPDSEENPVIDNPVRTPQRLQQGGAREIPGYAKPGYGGLIGSIQQKAAPGSFWDGREAERALYEKFKGAAPAAAMTHNAQSPAAVEVYKNMYK